MTLSVVKDSLHSILCVSTLLEMGSLWLYSVACARLSGPQAFRNPPVSASHLTVEVGLHMYTTNCVWFSVGSKDSISCYPVAVIKTIIKMQLGEKDLFLLSIYSPLWRTVRQEFKGGTGITNLSRHHGGMLLTGLHLG